MSRTLLALGCALLVGLGLLTTLPTRTGPRTPELGSSQLAPAPEPVPAPAPVAAAPDTTPTQPAPEPAPPAWETPPRTPTSWALPMALGWDSVDVGEPIHSPVAFRLPRCTDRDERFQARISDAAGRRYAFAFPVAGLLPRAMAKERSELVLGDEVIVARAPVLLTLPELSLPAHVELVTPDGQLVATLRLTEVVGEVRALRVR